MIKVQNIRVFASGQHFASGGNLGNAHIKAGIQNDASVLRTILTKKPNPESQSQRDTVAWFFYGRAKALGLKLRKDSEQSTEGLSITDLRVLARDYLVLKAAKVAKLTGLSKNESTILKSLPKVKIK